VILPLLALTWNGNLGREIVSAKVEGRGEGLRFAHGDGIDGFKRREGGDFADECLRCSGSHDTAMERK
jgi:hypothetical protein